MQRIPLRVLVSLGFLGLLFYLMRDQIPQILETLKNVDKPLLAASVLVFFAAVLIIAWRLKLIFAAEDVPISLWETSNLTFVGYFFNNFLPTSVGGDVVKALCASRITGEAVKSVTSVVLDRLFGLFTFIIIPGFTFLFISKEVQSPAVPVIIYSFLGVSVFSFFLLFNRPFARRFKFIGAFLDTFHWGGKVRRIYDGLHRFKRHKKVVARAMVLSLAGQAISIFVIYGMAVALGITANVVYFFLLVPVVHLLSMLPSLNGLGIRESAYIFFLKPQIGAHNAAALGILWLGLLFFLSVIGGLIYLVRHDYHIRFEMNGGELR